MGFWEMRAVTAELFRAKLPEAVVFLIEIGNWICQQYSKRLDGWTGRFS